MKKATGEPLMDNHPGAKKLFQQQAETLREIKHGGILSLWNLRLPPTLFPCIAGKKSVRQKNRRSARSRRGFIEVRFEGGWAVGVSAGPSSSACRWTGTCHPECEAAGLVLRDAVRWSGWPCLRSAQLLLPLIFNRCLGARPAKSSHMPERGNQSKDTPPQHRHTHIHSC